MKRLLQINPVLRKSTSTGRIMQEIGELAISGGWESYVAYSRGRDGEPECASELVPVGDRLSVAWHGAETRLADRHGLASDRATRQFVRRIEEIRPDIIHIHNIHGYFLNYRILFDFLSSSGIPVVWTVHDCWLYTGHCYYYTAAGCGRWRTGCGHCPQKREFPKSLWADRSRRNWEDKKRSFTSMPRDRFVIVPVSGWIRSEMEDSFLKDYSMQVIHNGIDTDIFSPSAPSDAVGKYGLEGKHIILGVASIWSREKGLADFMEMARRLRDDEALVLVGLTGKQIAALPERVTGISRTADVRELAGLYAAADVFVNPTWQDNYPTVNLEAVSCGTPVVTYRTGGSPESVTPETGFIVEPGDLDGVMKAVRTIEMSDRQQYRDKCRACALEYFRKSDRYGDYIRLYERLCGR